jgi:hypothetical protein
MWTRIQMLSLMAPLSPLAQDAAHAAVHAAFLLQMSWRFAPNELAHTSADVRQPQPESGNCDARTLAYSLVFAEA